MGPPALAQTGDEGLVHGISRRLVAHDADPGGGPGRLRLSRQRRAQARDQEADGEGSLRGRHDLDLGPPPTAARGERETVGSGRGQFFFLISQVKPSTGSLPTIGSPIVSEPAMRAMGMFLPFSTR